MKLRNLILILLATGCGQLSAQTEFRFRRDISGVETEGWYTLSFPPDIFQRLNSELGDLRLYSTAGGDTLERPYLLRIREDEVKEEKVSLRLFNRSIRNGVLYLTFESASSQKINFLELRFAESNYFGNVTLEGSDDRREWFEIIKDQRIVSISKADVSFKFSTISFPLSSYRYLRLSIASDVALNFMEASFGYKNIQPGNFYDIPLTWKIKSDRDTQQSIIDLKFTNYVPVTRLQVEVSNDEDFYRGVELMYVKDSTRTEKGWQRSYRGILDGHLTSFKNNGFDFPAIFTRELRLVVRDLDNQPLHIERISAAGPEVNVISYLKPGNNFMLYGGEMVRKPSYDLAHFESRIPDKLQVAVLDIHEQVLVHGSDTPPLFENRLWLWGILSVVILVLGFFTLKMMKK